MNLVHLALRRIVGSPFRSGLVFLCIVLVAGSTVWATLIIQGAEENLRNSVAGMENLGVDFLVIPRVGRFSSIGVGNVDLEELMSKIHAIPGIENSSPQLLLSTLSESKYCSEAEMFLVAFDPTTDFSVLTRLQEQPDGKIGIGEAIAGSLVTSPDGGNELNLVAYKLKLVGRLSPTGTSLDQSLFITFDTVQEIAQQRSTKDNGSSGIIEHNAPYILVKVELGNDPQKVALLIRRNIPGVTVFESTNFFHKGYNQMISLLRNIPGLLGIGWGLAVVCIGLAFAIAVNERRREIGVLRALGFPGSFIFRSLLVEGLILTLSGGVVGIVISVFAAILIRDGIAESTGPLLLLALESLGLAILSVFLAVIFPAWKISRQDPAMVMRG